MNLWSVLLSLEELIEEIPVSKVILLMELVFFYLILLIFNSLVYIRPM